MLTSNFLDMDRAQPDASNLRDVHHHSTMGLPPQIHIVPQAVNNDPSVMPPKKKAKTSAQRNQKSM